MALVVFLRGCNVGGSRTFRPTILARQMKRYGMVNIGAAGTFVLRKRTSRSKLLTDLRRRLPFDADVMICEGRDVLRIASADPFAGQPIRPDIVRFVSVLDKRPRRRPAIPLSIPEDGHWSVKVLAVEDRFVMGVYRRQMKAIGYLGSLDGIFGARATTRSWSTITAIVKVLGRTGRSET